MPPRLRTPRRSTTASSTSRSTAAARRRRSSRRWRALSPPASARASRRVSRWKTGWRAAASSASTRARPPSARRPASAGRRADRTPAFPGRAAPEPIARNLQGLSEAVVSLGADVGLATDGDADRLGVMDEQGRFGAQLQTFALLCYYLLEYRGLRAPIVRSVTSTRMIDRLGALYGVAVHETPVGLKYLGPRMLETGASAAGEESGGEAFAQPLPESGRRL